MSNAVRALCARLACVVALVAASAGIASSSPDARATQTPAAARFAPFDEGSLAQRARFESPVLDYSDEYDRAELVDEMLKECRGVPVNAYELAQVTGERLHRPAPLQLLVVRVRHPLCRELLRAYAPKTRV